MRRICQQLLACRLRRDHEKDFKHNVAFASYYIMLLMMIETSKPTKSLQKPKGKNWWERRARWVRKSFFSPIMRLRISEKKNCYTEVEISLFLRDFQVAVEAPLLPPVGITPESRDRRCNCYWQVSMNILLMSKVDHGGLKLDFADFDSGVRLFCPFAIPSLLNFHLPKLGQTEEQPNQSQQKIM